MISKSNVSIWRYYYWSSFNHSKSTTSIAWQETAQECLNVLRDLKISDMTAWTNSDSILLDEILEEIEKVMKMSEKIKQSYV